MKPATNAAEALADLRAWFDGSGPILTTTYALQLVELITAEREGLSRADTGRCLDAVNRALAILEDADSFLFAPEEAVEVLAEAFIPRAPEGSVITETDRDR